MSRFLLPAATAGLCASMFLISGCGESTDAGSSNATDNVDSVAAPAFDISTPDGAAQSSVAHMRNDNIAAIVTEALTPDQLAKITAKWEEVRKTEVGSMEKNMFAKQLEKYVSGAFIDEAMPMVEGQLANLTTEKIAAMVPMLGMMLSSPDLNLTPEQQAEAQKFIAGLAEWVKTSDIANPEVTRTALKVVQATVVKLNLSTLDAAAELSIDQLLEKAGVISAGVKKVLNVYGLDVNEILDSVTIKKVSEDGDKATLEITVKAFGGEFTNPCEVIKLNGIWVDATKVDKINEFFANL